MDYGTGHETSFALFLLCLTLIRFFEPEPKVEREIVLMVFLRYLRLCWKLQDVYRLEPAGSHGVWGLDDYSFLGYIFGSAQLRGWYRLLQVSRSMPDPRFRPDGHPRLCNTPSAAATNESVLSLNLAHN